MARILVIAAATADMQLIELALKQVGHLTLTAADADTGIGLAHALLPELIIMDFQLPGIDARSAIRRLKDQTATRYIPVIALTLPINGAEERMLATGCDGFLVKPLFAENLRSEVALQLGRRNIVA